MSMTVEDVFHAAQLEPSGAAPWHSTVPEMRSGVYAVAVTPDVTASNVLIDVTYLPSDEIQLWNSGELVIYIGSTQRPLQTRIGEFYRHKYGNDAPHSGGQAVMLLWSPLWVYWAATEDPHAIEHVMIEAFKVQVGKRPFANRRNERKAVLSQL